jgi:hypothetical protein
MPENFQKLLNSFILRLLDRGHTLPTLAPIFTQAAMILDQKALGDNLNTTNNSNTLFIHWQYHPDGLQRSDIRNTYKKTLEPHLPFDNMKVAVSRPKNLRDILTKTALNNLLKL